MSMMITFRISDDRAERLDALVGAHGYPTRAAAIVEALDRLLAEEARRAVDRAIVDGYTRVPPTSDETAWAEWSADESIRDEPW
jgi:Arc/MetJ-type ribon-helix-helix transcriptional regulator